MSARQAADVLGVTVVTVHRMVKDRRLEAAGYTRGGPCRGRPALLLTVVSVNRLARARAAVRPPT